MQVHSNQKLLEKSRMRREKLNLTKPRSSWGYFNDHVQTLTCVLIKQHDGAYLRQSSLWHHKMCSKGAACFLTDPGLDFASYWGAW